MPPIGVIAVGLVIGALGAFNSLGMILLWRTTRVVNLAQPSLGLVGGVVSGLLVTSAGWSFWWALPVGLMVGAVLGVFTERVVLRRLADAPRAVLLVVTIGLAAIYSGIQAGIPFVVVGHALPSYSIDLGVNFFLPGGAIQGAHIATIVALPLCLLGSYFFLHKTKFGLSALALGQDQERARALGVPAATVRALVWALAGVLATVSGIFVIPIRGFQLGGALEGTVLLLALAPAVFAGFRSLVGATVAALALGVAFQTFLWIADTAGLSQLILAFALLAAIAIQGRRVGRDEAAVRASSWEAAATPRPIPWAIRKLPSVRILQVLLAVGLLVVGFSAPFFISPSSQVIYGNGAALALGAVSVVAAWMFAGEVALGHWGFAGLGAAIAAILPGPWLYRIVVAAILMGVVGAILGLASRRRSNLSFAVLGIAAATTGPVALLAVSEREIIADPRLAAAVAGASVVAAAIAIVWLRSSITGTRWVAARDDAQRGPWIGANPISARMVSLGLSIGLAGLAGGLTAANSPTGLISGSSSVVGAFDFIRSLDILAMAVVGGLGSPAGAVAASALIVAGRHFLPNAWVLLVSGLGITLIVIFQPAGISRLISMVRNLAANMLSGSPVSQRRAEEPEKSPEIHEVKT